MAANVCGSGNIELPAGIQEVLQGLAFQQLHDEERQSIVSDADIEDVHDTAMTGGRGHLGLPLEPGHGFRHLAVFCLEELERDPFADVLVDGLKDLPHATYSEAVLQQILAGDYGPFLGHDDAHSKPWPSTASMSVV